MHLLCLAMLTLSNGQTIMAFHIQQGYLYTFSQTTELRREGGARELAASISNIALPVKYASQDIQLTSRKIIFVQA